jgi:hypothetical protein
MAPGKEPKFLAGFRQHEIDEALRRDRFGAPLRMAMPSGLIAAKSCGSANVMFDRPAIDTWLNP